GWVRPVRATARSPEGLWRARVLPAARLIDPSPGDLAGGRSAAGARGAATITHHPAHLATMFACWRSHNKDKQYVLIAPASRRHLLAHRVRKNPTHTGNNVPVAH